MRQLPKACAVLCSPAQGRASKAATVLLLLAAGAGCNRGGDVAGQTGPKRRDPEPLVVKTCSGGDPQTVDVNNDGKPDISHHVSGGKRLCSEIDMNFDGKIDVHRFYAEDGTTVAFEQHDYDFDGRLDQQTFFEAGALKRKELDTNFDGLVDTWMWCAGPLVERSERARRKPGRVDTWMTFTNGRLSEIQYDENSDDRIEKWEIFTDGTLSETRIDTTGDGKVDRTEIATMQGSDDQDKPVSCDGSQLPIPSSAPSAPPASGGEAPATSPSSSTSPAGAAPASASSGTTSPAGEKTASGEWQER